MFQRVKTFLFYLIIAFVVITIGTIMVLIVTNNIKVTTKLKTEEHAAGETISVEKTPPEKSEEELQKEAEKKAEKVFKIDTDDGFVRGEERRYKYGKNNETYYAFQGIPYAKPPVGNLRFKDPKAVVPWENVYDATKERSICPQKSIPGRAPSKIIGSEDCLYLNIYTPQRPDKMEGLKPVMVWFHGGGFQTGSGNTDYFGPDFIVNHDVILITFNYRLGALGFLNLEISNAPGNSGLKDQVAVLKWINSNISQFGGDPNNVTLFGVDAGAASIQMLTLALDLKKHGLFHKVILQSGSVMNPWAFTDENENKATELADALGIKSLSEDYEKIIEDLQNKPVEDIINAQDSIVTLQDLESLNLYAFVPSVEKVINGTSHGLITSNPSLAFSSGHLTDIPTIAGITNSEANIAFLYCPDLITPQTLESLNLVPDAFIPSLIKEFDNDIIKNIAKNVIKKVYFKDEHISWDKIPEFFKLLSDGLVSIGMYMTIEIMKQTPSPLYVYEFSFEGDLNYVGNKAKEIFMVKNDNERMKAAKALPHGKGETTADSDKSDANNSTATTTPATNTTSTSSSSKNATQIDYDKIKISGAAHEDELGYLFLVNKFDKEIIKDKKEHQIREQLTLMWTNFAKNTNPNSDQVNVDWQECNDKNPTFLNIGNKIELIKGDVETDRYMFWKNLFIAIFQGNPSIIINYLQKHHLI